MSNNQFKFLSGIAIIIMTAISFSITACNEIYNSEEKNDSNSNTSLLQDTGIIDSIIVCDTIGTDSVFVKK